MLGAVAAVMLRGMPNDVYFTIGLVTIIGLAAKDAILIIEFAKELRARGKPLIEAAVEAAHLRFRPILMTGFAFVFGVAPMVIASCAAEEPAGARDGRDGRDDRGRRARTDHGAGVLRGGTEAVCAPREEGQRSGERAPVETAETPSPR